MNGWVGFFISDSHTSFTFLVKYPPPGLKTPEESPEIPSQSSRILRILRTFSQTFVENWNISNVSSSASDKSTVRPQTKYKVKNRRIDQIARGNCQKKTLPKILPLCRSYIGLWRQHRVHSQVKLFLFDRNDYRWTTKVLCWTAQKLGQATKDFPRITARLSQEMFFPPKY